MTVLSLPACICWSNCCQFSAHTVDPRNLRLACWHLPLRWTLCLRSCYTSPVPGESIQSANPRILTLVFPPWERRRRYGPFGFLFVRQALLMKTSHSGSETVFSKEIGVLSYLVLLLRILSPLLLVAFSVPANAQGTEMGRCSCPSLPWRFQTLLLLPSL